MDTKAYISSGILELYVLDALDPAAAREVEDMVARHPEIREELDRIEVSLEMLALTLAPEVDPAILDRTLLAVVALPVADPSLPPADAAPATPAEKMARNSLATWLPWVLAISAFAGLLWVSLLLSNRTENITALENRYTALERSCAQTNEALRSAQQQLDYLSDPNTRDVLLAGTPNAPDKLAQVFNNETTGQTYLRAVNLPAPPAGQQYQLWAIGADGPQSIAVLALDLASETLLPVDFQPGTATFAITLEDLGGKESPDLDAIQVAGDVAG